jgi:hypothetical protein
MAGSKRDLFTSLLLGNDPYNFFPSDKFIAMAADWSAYAEADYINANYIGAPVGIATGVVPAGGLTRQARADIPDRIQMQHYRTANVITVPYSQQFAVQYDMMASYVAQSKMALKDKVVADGLWRSSPYQNTAKTPLLVTPAGNALIADSKRQITFKDVTDLKAAISRAYPELQDSDFAMIMDTYAYYDFIANNAVLANQMAWQNKTGDLTVTTVKIHGIEIYCDERLPVYTNGATPQRTPIGTAFVPTNHHKSATLFIKKRSFGIALGALQTFETLRDASSQSDNYSFSQYAYMGPMSENLQTNLTYLGGILRS